jgi:hypothetical protein
VLRRNGLFDDWSLFDRLGESETLSWWNAEPITIDDIPLAGNEAIRRHHTNAHLFEVMVAVCPRSPLHRGRSTSATTTRGSPIS